MAYKRKQLKVFDLGPIALSKKEGLLFSVQPPRAKTEQPQFLHHLGSIPHRVLVALEFVRSSLRFGHRQWKLTIEIALLELCSNTGIAMYSYARNTHIPMGLIAHCVKLGVLERL